MKRTPIFHSILLKEDTWARAYLNEMPLYRSAFLGPDSRSGPINDLLVPGENEISIELLRTKKLHHGAFLKHAITLNVFEVTNPEALHPTPFEQRMIVDMKFPDVMEALDTRHQRYPMYFRATFDPGVDIADPPFAGAPEADFGCEGTPDLRDALKRLHDTVARCDVEAFLNEISLKLEHAERALEGEEAMTAKQKKDGFREQLFKFEPEPQPLDFADIHFHALLGGRVAHVTRLDGGFALDAVCRKDPKRRMRTDLLMTRHQGQWRVFA